MVIADKGDEYICAAWRPAVEVMDASLSADESLRMEEGVLDVISCESMLDLYFLLNASWPTEVRDVNAHVYCTYNVYTSSTFSSRTLP